MAQIQSKQADLKMEWAELVIRRELGDMQAFLEPSFNPCFHRKIKTFTTGSRRYVEGDVTDDIKDQFICMDCGEVLTEREIRSIWNGDRYAAEPSMQFEEDYDVDF